MRLCPNPALVIDRGAIVLESRCCREGNAAITPLPQLPEGWEEMIHKPAFRIHSRKYNNLFAFTAMRVLGDQGFVHQLIPS